MHPEIPKEDSLSTTVAGVDIGALGVDIGQRNSRYPRDDEGASYSHSNIDFAKVFNAPSGGVCEGEEYDVGSVEGGRESKLLGTTVRRLDSWLE